MLIMVVVTNPMIVTVILTLREAPLKKAPPLFVHCPNSYCYCYPRPHPPAHTLKAGCMRKAFEDDMAIDKTWKLKRDKMAIKIKVCENGNKDNSVKWQ